MDLCRETVWDTPNDGTQYAKLEEADRVYDFLAGLNPKFGTVYGRILGRRPLPSLMEVRFEVYLKEDRTNAMGVLTTPTINSAAFSARSSNHDSDKNNGKSIPEVRNGPPTRNRTQDVPTLVRLPLPALLNQLVLLRARPRLRLWVPLLSQDMSSGKTIGTARHSRGLYILDEDTSCSSFSRGDAILTAAHLINRMSSCILHLQTPLDCLKESYPYTRLVSEVPLRVFWCTAYVHNFGPNQIKFTPRTQACVFVGYPLHQRGYKCFHPPSRKYFVTVDVTFCENRPYFPVSHLQEESVSEESNSTFEFIEPTPSTVSDVDPHPIILPTNQVPGKTYYRRNLKKEVGSPTSQPPAPVQDFEPSRDQGMENPTEPCTNNTMSENDRSDVAVLENMEEKNRNDETEIRIETSNKEVEQGHTRKLDEYDPSLDILIALRKDGTLDRHKARLVAKGFTQTYGIDYSETFSPVAKLNTVRVLLSVAVNKDWPLYQLDVKNAFLNGNLVEEVYMSPRQDLKRNLVSKFTTLVKSQGYSQGHSDHTLFTNVSKTGKIAILIVYMDDIVLTGDDQIEISQLKQRMGDEFEIKDLGNLKYFLGIEVARYKEGISVSQRKYTLDLLTETAPYPILPDISFVVSVASQFMQAPYEKHMEASKKQSIEARSSVEAEYRAMSLGICEKIWLQKVLSDLHQGCEIPLKLFCDNKAAISIANNSVQHDKTKHVEIDCHFIKERLDNRSICILYIPSNQQVADVLTKGLLILHFNLCVSKLGLIDIYVPT
ncbi:Cysteine-rich RLK (RECEPTOR-like protein kinase) 8 [Cucumis melo var. makuwa]|uniref:Cysteine-rich RLK (RECEPTOR-like protein kinase) 8 n=1 Tax=Cucumis melo var. makuwa TaxID=1194695 RepID=A0A5A7TKW9_CUCMM|nr:Cysteine-rich RLK (RECEPTOR-like protein kinase) 8 [Cucumis melo var. makuwa]